MIARASEARLHAIVCAKSIALRCDPIAVGGMPDHVHLLVRIPSTVTIAMVAQAVKGASSCLMNDEIQPGGSFAWQSSYGARSVDPWDVSTVAAYVRNQRVHHDRLKTVDDLEAS